MTSKLVSHCAGDSDASRVRRFGVDVGDDRVAVADRLAIVNDVGKLPARGGRGIEDVLVSERHAGEFEEGVDLQSIAVVVGDAEKGGVRIRVSMAGLVLAPKRQTKG